MINWGVIQRGGELYLGWVVSSNVETRFSRQIRPMTAKRRRCEERSRREKGGEVKRLVIEEEMRRSKEVEERERAEEQEVAKAEERVMAVEMDQKEEEKEMRY